MEEFLGVVAFGMAAIAVAFFVLWVVAAAVARILAWLLVAWLAAFAVGFAAGIVTGVVLPPRVLRGKADKTALVATPDAVVAGKVLGDAPKGQAKHFGWDHAWPLYLPHQAKRDANAVLSQNHQSVNGSFQWLFSKTPIPLWVVLVPPLAGFGLGAWLSALVWYGVMALLGGIIYIIQLVGILGLSGYDRLVRHHRKATLRCTKCYRVTTTPSYRCSNADCTTIHHDIRPGPLGIIHRRCGCGTNIPATVGGAAKQLVTVCPYCIHELPRGSGTRRVLPVPVIGAVAAGKTQFLTSGIVELKNRVESMSGTLAPISAEAEEFLTVASATISTGQVVAKTSWATQPEGVPFILELQGRQLELQILDAAGEYFVDWERSQGLGYMDSAEMFLFVLDPLALPPVAEQMLVAKKGGVVPIAQGDPADAYASVVDRLRAEDVRLGAKSIAIVLTKLDILRSLPNLDPLDPSNSDSVKTWLRKNGADGFVRRLGQDFKNMEFFAVDSCGTRDGHDAVHPVRVFDWMLRTTDSRMSVFPTVALVPAGEVTQ